MKASFDHFDDETANVRTFWFKPERELRYTAGQFTELTIRHISPDDRGEKRWFTLSSTPGGELVSITTKHAVDHSSTFKNALWALQPGHSVDLADAMGDFVLPKLIQTPLIFVAGGIGVTPFHSMAGWLAATNESRPIRLLWGINYEDDVLFTDTFNNADIDPTIIVSQPSAAWGGERGKLSAKLILGLEKPSADALIYLSGPEPMLEALQVDLLKHGIQQSQLVTDFFPGYTQF